MIWSRKQAEFIVGSTARLNIAVGAVRSGKTLASLARWVAYAAQAPAGDLYMVGKSERTLRRNCIVPLQRMVGSRLCVYRQGTGELWLGRGRSRRRCYVVGAADARSTAKIQGATAAGLYGDEFVTWPEDFFRMALSRLSVRGSQAFVTANPDNPHHWAKREWIDRAEEIGAKVWHFRLDDNPFLDPSVVEGLKRFYTGMWYRRYILGEWCVGEGAVYDMWGEHVFEEAAVGVVRYVAGIDYGTGNPFCLVVVGEDGARCWHVVGEWYYAPDPGRGRRQMTDGEYVAAVGRALGGLRPEVIAVDPSAASFVAAARGAGLPVVLARNEVLDGIRTVGGLLAGGRLRFVRGAAPNVVASIEGYVWDGAAAARGQDSPLKRDDHGADALRYALHTVLGQRRGSVVVGPPVGGGRVLV